MAPDAENFAAIRELYDVEMAGNVIAHDLIYPHVFGDDGYVGQFSDNSARELLLMARSMRLSPGAEVLDVGCGRGSVAFYLASQLGWRVTGIDISSRVVAEAERRIDPASPGPVPHFIRGNFYDLHVENGFDGVYGTGAFCHFDAERLFRHAFSLLRPKGRLAFMERTRTGELSEPEWKHLTQDWACPSLYTTSEYETLCRACGFSVELVLDLTDTFRVWQRRSVEVREQLKDEIIDRTSPDYFNTSLSLASYENDVSAAGRLGYILLVARKLESR